MACETLLLFDIDGTLLRPCGLGRRSLDRAFHERFGKERVFDGIRFDGRTDFEIFRDGLSRVGGGELDLEGLVARYLWFLESEVDCAPPLVLPGIIELLEIVGQRADVVLGLVTGNVRRGAEIKLTRDGLWPRFRLGAFGDDHSDRAELVRVACSRASVLGFGAAPPSRVIHVGDTENDVLAARRAGAIAVAVATGGQDSASLATHAPDHLFDSLEPASRFIAELLS